MKIEEYIQSLPKNIISGEEVQLPDHSLREIFEFVDINEKDIFYHLGCGDGKAIVMALQEFQVKRAVGIDTDAKKINLAKKILIENKLENAEIIQKNILDANIEDATVILFWFTDTKIIEGMMEKFNGLKNGCRIITLWGPLPGVLPEKVNFPYIINQIPFKPSKDLKDQLLAVFGTKCIDFVNAWEFAERYTKAIGIPEAGNDRFLTIMQTLVIWINARNLGLTCEDKIPPAVDNYMKILRNFFNIEVEHLLKKS